MYCRLVVTTADAIQESVRIRRTGAQSIAKRAGAIQTGVMRNRLTTRGLGGSREGGQVREEELPAADLPNIAGRRLIGPSAGFGQLWRKRFWMVLPPELAPEAVIGAWKNHFSEFWPGTNEFVVERMAEEEVAGADLELPLGMRVATGLVVLAAAADRFTLVTVEGHMFAGWVTFRGERKADGTRIEVELLMRASDPLYELGLLLGGHKREETFWRDTLARVAAHFEQSPQIEMEQTIEDRARQWSRARNTWNNAAIRTQVQRVKAGMMRGVRSRQR